MSADTVKQFHSKLLQPAFPPAELMTPDELTQALVDGDTDGILAFINGQLAGGVVGERYVDGLVELISYLVVDRTLRSRGLGRSLLRRGVRLFSSELVLAEIEDPRYWTPTAENDTAARLRFYERERCRVLPIPYVQPSLRPGSPRVRNLLLIAVPVDDSSLPTHVQGSLIRDFLTEYFTACEGDVPVHDPEYSQMQDAASDDSVPLLAFDRLAAVRRGP
jgi:hypothetical protein